MTAYVSSALFVYTDANKTLSDALQSNELGVQVTPVTLDDLRLNPASYLKDTQHVVVAGALPDIKEIISLTLEHDFSIGLIPEKAEKQLIKTFDLPPESEAMIDLALQDNAQAIDLTLCNDQVLLFKATIGRLPLLDATNQTTKLRFLFDSLRKSFQLKLLKFSFTTEKGKKITTGASGCIILQQHKGSLLSKLVENDNSLRNTSVSILVSSPVSIIVYCNMLLRLLYGARNNEHIPRGIGYIKTSQVDIETTPQLKINIDSHCETQTPLHCQVIPGAVHINIGADLTNACNNTHTPKESIKLGYLPNEKELEQVSRQNIPFFSHASEQRFRELFISLREDAKISSIYITLMILSTLLATIGLFQSSTAVVIGAMLLAPLMAPIVSLAMGLLRGNMELLKNSVSKILVGIALALLASALITQLFPHKMITNEMTSRLSPNLLDLAVAIVSGIAGAYSKSFKEILQSLAGVAVAVALVPPLAVAGIGIGRGNIDFFLQAFLLFSTNLVGITLAATFTFRLLGFSPIVYAKRGIGIVFAIFLVIAVPLYTSYDRIIETIAFESLMEKNRFLVNGKYMMISNPRLTHSQGERMLHADLLTRDDINRKDLIELKKKIKLNFSGKLTIKVQIIYIL